MTNQIANSLLVISADLRFEAILQKFSSLRNFAEISNRKFLASLPRLLIVFFPVWTYGDNLSPLRLSEALRLLQISWDT